MSDDEAQQALIGRGDADNTALLYDRDIDDDARSLSDAKLGGAPGLFVWMLTAAAGISGLLFGCKFGSSFSLTRY